MKQWRAESEDRLKNYINTIHVSPYVRCKFVDDDQDMANEKEYMDKKQTIPVNIR